MSQVSGVVTKVFKKTKTKGGAQMKSPTYAIHLDDSDWYNCGFDAPDCVEGDVISFDASDGKYGKEVDVTTIKVLDKSSPAGRAASATVDAKQESIVYQSSLKAAIELIGIALANEALVLPSKKAERFDFLVEVAHKTAKDISVIAGNPSAVDEEEEASGIPDDE